MYRRIAVTLDRGTAGRSALRWAVAIARRANSSLDLVNVAVPAVHGEELYAAAVLHEDDVKRLEGEAERELRAVADEVAAAGVRATPVVLRGEVPSALADHLRTHETDLVVMTTHDHGRIERLLLGSVSESVMRHAHVPVLLVRAHESDSATEAEPVIRKILVPLDGSPFSEQILPPVTVLAKLMSADLTLLSVLEPIMASAALSTGIGATSGVDVMPVLGLMPPSEVASIGEVDDERARLDSQTLERTAERIRTQGLAVRTSVLTDGRPAHAIVEFAKLNDFDLIAMTTHGRGALKRLLIGSLSEAVLHMTPSHMLMYRPEQPAAT
jgi:nucleotide-binding universal stress UspA family protein